MKRADALDDRASFRRFWGFSGTKATPERTAFVRFRRLPVAYNLDRALFDAVTAQLAAKAITVKAGTIVDATIIASASEGDGDARWAKHRGKRATHGFKPVLELAEGVHVGCDADTALVGRIAVTPAKVNDGRAGPDALPDARLKPLRKSAKPRCREQDQSSDNSTPLRPVTPTRAQVSRYVRVLAAQRRGRASTPRS